MENNSEYEYQSIEELIKQHKSVSPHIKAIISVMYLSNRIENCLDNLFAQYDITHQQFNVLRILRGGRKDGLYINEIKERMIDINSDTSRLIDRLEFRNFVTKAKVDEDKRKTLIQITEKAKEVLAEIDQREQSTFERFFAEFSAEDLRIFSKYTEIAINNVLQTIAAKNES